MRHAVIFAHPDTKSFIASIAETYRDAAESRGHTTIVRDLYGIGFDPCLKRDEIPGRNGFSCHSDVAAERAVLAEVDVFVLVYPLWLNAPPAIMKGYLERVFGLGFAYGPGESGNEPLLSGKKLISITSSGAPTAWVHSTGAWDAMHKLFDDYFANLCGLSLVDHVHFGSIVPAIRPDVVAHHLQSVRDLFARTF